MQGLPGATPLARTRFHECRQQCSSSVVAAVRGRNRSLARGASAARRASGSASRISRRKNIASCCCRIPPAALPAARRRPRQAAGRVVAVACGGIRRAIAARAVFVSRKNSARRRPRSWLWDSPTAHIASTATVAPRASAASLEAPPNADMRLRRARGGVAAHGARLDQYAGAAISARRNWLPRRASSPIAIRPRIKEWVGEELLGGKFSGHSRRGTRQQRGAAPGRVALGAARRRRAYPRLTLVGKGVCFDSGGLDIKPSSGMALMKKDMGGAAVALALAHMLMSVKIRAQLRVLVPAVENAISGNAYRPGDVLATRKGLTRRGRQHRCGRPAGAVRCPGVRRCRASGS